MSTTTEPWNIWVLGISAFLRAAVLAAGIGCPPLQTFSLHLRHSLPGPAPSLTTDRFRADLKARLEVLSQQPCAKARITAGRSSAAFPFTMPITSRLPFVNPQPMGRDECPPVPAICLQTPGITWGKISCNFIITASYSLFSALPRIK